jgi:hypothetical protein
MVLVAEAAGQLLVEPLELMVAMVAEELVLLVPLQAQQIVALAVAAVVAVRVLEVPARSSFVLHAP